MSPTDLELLKDYEHKSAEDAFAELVRRYLGLVYSAALRQVRSRQLAEEIAQATFLKLARHARRLPPNTIVAAWLYQVTRREAIDAIRAEVRRRKREQMASEIHAMNAFAEDWTPIEPLLDEAMHALEDADRAAVLLRYFENKSLREVGQALGSSDDAAQKRVSRALERLRQYFAKRGVTAGASAIAVVLSTHAAQAAPASLAGAISAAAAALATTTFAATSTTIAMTTLQKALITAAITAAVGTGIYEAWQVAGLRQEVQALRQEHASLNQNAQREREEATAALATLRDENLRLQNDATELPRLREEVSRLRTRALDLAKTRSTAPASNAAPATADNPPGESDLPKETWGDVGFATPQDALRTRGWAILNGSRERFKDSVFITASARKMLEDMFVKMAEASKDPNKAQYIQEILNSGFGVEEGILMPMMAENEKRGYAGYRVVSEQALSESEKQLEVETRMESARAKTETLKFRRIANDWKVVIDENFIKAR